MPYTIGRTKMSKKNTGSLHANHGFTLNETGVLLDDSNSQKQTSQRLSTFSLVNIVAKGFDSSKISPFLNEHMFSIKLMSNSFPLLHIHEFRYLFHLCK